MKELLFIYNPNSGQQMIGDYMNWIINFLSSKGYVASFYATQKSGDARELVVKIGKITIELWWLEEMELLMRLYREL